MLGPHVQLGAGEDSGEPGCAAAQATRMHGLPAPSGAAPGPAPPQLPHPTPPASAPATDCRRAAGMGGRAGKGAAAPGPAADLWPPWMGKGRFLPLGGTPSTSPSRRVSSQEADAPWKCICPCYSEGNMAPEQGDGKEGGKAQSRALLAVGGATQIDSSYHVS